MPPSNQNSYNSESFTVCLDRILARLRAVFTDAGFVRVLSSPDGRIPTYKAEDGLAVCPLTPRPLPLNGAGRYGRNTIRDVLVFVTTMNLLDEAGSDEAAVRAHIAREESVCNVLEQTPPSDVAYSNRIGTIITWVETGEDIQRQLKTDAGLFQSCLRFRVQFVQPMTVYRD